MGTHLSLRELVAAGGVILLLLAILSIYSLALMLERWSAYRRSMKDIEAFLGRLRQSLSRGDLSEVMAICRQCKGPAAEVVLSSLVGPAYKEDRKRSTERILERELTKLRRGVDALGTISSVSPFIGLFGTVLGVMRAFRDLAGATGAGPGVVAVGIAEALITTAAGLFVAIPATIAYNYFTARAFEFSDELRWITDDILDHLTQKTAP